MKKLIIFSIIGIVLLAGAYFISSAQKNLIGSGNGSQNESTGSSQFSPGYIFDHEAHHSTSQAPPQ